MKSTLYRVVLSGTALIGTMLLLASTTTAQDQMRFRAMDRNGDGVVTRAEWQGSDQSFRQQDRNGDGILSGDEVRVAQGAGIVDVFALVDVDGNGKVTTQEWRRAFTQLDVDGDGLLTEDELWSRSTPPVPTRAERSRPGATAVSATGVRRAAKTATNEGRGISRASGSSNRPMRVIAASLARATSTRPAIAKASGRDTRKDTESAAPWNLPCHGA